MAAHIRACGGAYEHRRLAPSGRGGAICIRPPRARHRVGRTATTGEQRENNANEEPYPPESSRTLLREYIDAGDLCVQADKDFYEYPSDST